MLDAKLLIGTYRPTSDLGNRPECCVPTQIRMPQLPFSDTYPTPVILLGELPSKAFHLHNSRSWKHCYPSAKNRLQEFAGSPPGCLPLSVAPGPHASLLPWPSCPLHFCCTYLVCQCLFLVPGNEHELRKQQDRIQSAKMNQGLTQRLEKHTNVKNSWKQCPVSWTEPKRL